MAEESKQFIKEQLKKFVESARRLVPGQGAADLLKGVRAKIDEATQK